MFVRKPMENSRSANGSFVTVWLTVLPCSWKKIHPNHWSICYHNTGHYFIYSVMTRGDTSYGTTAGINVMTGGERGPAHCFYQCNERARTAVVTNVTTTRVFGEFRNYDLFDYYKL
jgi:hypothetical protein